MHTAEQIIWITDRLREFLLRWDTSDEIDWEPIMNHARGISILSRNDDLVIQLLITVLEHVESVKEKESEVNG